MHYFKLSVRNQNLGPRLWVRMRNSKWLCPGPSRLLAWPFTVADTRPRRSRQCKEHSSEKSFWNSVQKTRKSATCIRSKNAESKWYTCLFASRPSGAMLPATLSRHDATSKMRATGPCGLIVEDCGVDEGVTRESNQRVALRSRLRDGEELISTEDSVPNSHQSSKESSDVPHPKQRCSLFQPLEPLRLEVEASLWRFCGPRMGHAGSYEQNILEVMLDSVGFPPCLFTRKREPCGKCDAQK